MKQGKWTREENKILIEMAGNYPVKEIAAKLDRSEQAVRSHACTMMIKTQLYGHRHHKSKTSEEDERFINALHNEGLAVNVIAEKLELSYHRVYNIVNR